MILFLLTYLHKRFGHRFNFNAANLPLQRCNHSMVLQPVRVQVRQHQVFKDRGI